MSTPEQRRDDTISRIIHAGGTILATLPLATTGDPHTVVAYQIDAGAPSPSVLPALAAIREDTETDLVGLVPWINPEMEVDDEGYSN